MILQKADTLTPINSDAFRRICDHQFWHDAHPFENRKLQHGDVAFCKIDEVWRFFRALRRTRARVVLVTGEGDKPVTRDLWDQKPSHVVTWFGTNMFVDHPRAHPIPLGLGNANGKLTLHWNEISKACQSQPKRNQLLYANFGISSNPIVREPLWDWVRKPEQFWITKENHSAIHGKAGYLDQLRTHRFVLCPPGNGEDTHRMWEALYCGAIPVVRTSPAMRAFHDLPIVFVEDLRAISPRLLEEHLEQLHSRSMEKLDLQTWQQAIDRERLSLRMKRPLTHREWMLTWFAEIFRVLKSRHLRSLPPCEINSAVVGDKGMIA